MQVRKVIAVILLNPKSKILIMKRSPQKKIHPNLWGLPSGGVEEGESFENAAKREVREETGLQLYDLQRGPMLSVKVPNAIHEINYYLAKTDKDKVSMNREHVEYKWVIPSESLKYHFGIPQSHVKKVLEKLNLL